VTHILIIMPALNEEESLPATLKELREVVDDHDILVIDDGSTDATAEVASRAGAVSAQLPFTLGVGGAVRVGLHYAQRNGYDRAVVIDADGQHDPAGIAALLEALDHGADIEEVPAAQLGLPGLDELLARRHARSGWPVALALIGREAWRRYETGQIDEKDFYCLEAQRAGLASTSEHDAPASTEDHDARQMGFQGTATR